MKHYDVLIARADRDLLDLVVALGGMLPITGMLDEDASVALYFDEGEFRPEYIERLNEQLNGAPVEFERAQVEEQNWNAEFERSLEPVHVGGGLIFTQSWNPVEPETGEMVVTIDPKMSFGTGHHETTRLVSRLLMKLDVQGKAVLDVGTGTGVLAIVAALRGAAPVVAFDNNEWAVGNTHENLTLNGVADRIRVFRGELDDLDEGTFDLILANLHRNLIIRLLPGFVERLRDDNSLLLTSGVLIEDYRSLLDAAAEHGLEPVDEERENEWIATTFARRDRSS